jgi:hypothetical protein
MSLLPILVLTPVTTALTMVFSRHFAQPLLSHNHKATAKQVVHTIPPGIELIMQQFGCQ